MFDQPGPLKENILVQVFIFITGNVCLRNKHKQDGCGVNPIQTSQRDNFLKCVKHILFFVPFELRALLSSLLAFSFIIDINIK